MAGEENKIIIMCPLCSKKDPKVLSPLYATWDDDGVCYSFCENYGPIDLELIIKRANG
jgi:hypothetical protein